MNTKIVTNHTNYKSIIYILLRLKINTKATVIWIILDYFQTTTGYQNGLFTNIFIDIK